MARGFLAVLAGLCWCAWGTPAAAKVATVLYGRVEDSLTREPLANVRLFAADSSAAVLTDSQPCLVLPFDSRLLILSSFDISQRIQLMSSGFVEVNQGSL